MMRFQPLELTKEKHGPPKAISNSHECSIHVCLLMNKDGPKLRKEAVTESKAGIASREDAEV